MLESELKQFYHRMLTVEEVPLKMKSEVLVNIEMYLMEEESRMIKLDLECMIHQRCNRNIIYLMCNVFRVQTIERRKFEGDG